MTATTILMAPTGVFLGPLFTAALLVVAIFAAVLLAVAFIGVRQARLARTLMTTALVAIALSLVTPSTAYAQEEEEDLVMLRIRCEGFERWSAEWWIFRCWLFDEGGGEPINTLVVKTEPAPAPQPATEPKKKG